MTTQQQTKAEDFNKIAMLCLKDDASEANNKRRGRVRAFATLYLASQAGVCDNVKLSHVAVMKDRLARGEAYLIAYQTIFNAKDGPSGSMKNKLKCAFDLLAYVAAAEYKAKQSLVKVYGDGDVVTFHESLIEPVSEIPMDERQWLKSEGKRGTSIEEVLRAGKKHADLVGVVYPGSNQPTKTKNETSKALSFVEALDYISGAASMATERGGVKSDTLEAVMTALACLTELASASKKVKTMKQAA